MIANFHPTTNLVLDLEFNNKSSGGYGEAKRGKYTSHYTYTKRKSKTETKDIVTIPYDAYKFIEMARDLLFKANVLIKQDCNISDIADLVETI